MIFFLSKMELCVVLKTIGLAAMKIVLYNIAGPAFLFAMAELLCLLLLGVY